MSWRFHFSAIGGNSDIVWNGVNELTGPATDVGSLADAITELLKQQSPLR